MQRYAGLEPNANPRGGSGDRRATRTGRNDGLDPASEEPALADTSRLEALKLARVVLEGKIRQFETVEINLKESFKKRNGLDAYHLELVPDTCSTVMFFEGSSTCKDWMYNFQRNQKSIGDRKIHSGFDAQLEPHKVTLKRALLAASKQTVVLVGHSLGGAIASLFADYLLTESAHLQVKLITIGSPKVGNEMWRSHMHANSRLEIHRITNSCDPVPMVPLIIYVHIGTHIHLKNGKCCMLNCCGQCCFNHCVPDYISAINQELDRSQRHLHPARVRWSNLFLGFPEGAQGRESLLQRLRTFYKINDLGEVLGICVQQETRLLVVYQQPLIEEIARNYEQDIAGISNTTRTTPYGAQAFEDLLRLDPTSSESLTWRKKCLQLAGKINYVAMEVYEALLHIARYLHTTVNYAIHYNPLTPQTFAQNVVDHCSQINSPTMWERSEPSLFCDASQGGSKPMMCALMFNAGTPLTWKMGKLTSTTLSLTEAEWFAQTAGAAILQHITPTLGFLGAAPEKAVLSFCDNKSAVMLDDELGNSRPRVPHLGSTAQDQLLVITLDLDLGLTPKQFSHLRDLTVKLQVVVLEDKDIANTDNLLHELFSKPYNVKFNQDNKGSMGRKVRRVFLKNTPDVHTTSTWTSENITVGNASIPNTRIHMPALQLLSDIRFEYAPSLSSVLCFASAIMFLRIGVYVYLTIGNCSTKDRKKKTTEEFDADMRESQLCFLLQFLLELFVAHGFG
ncbi:MAG: hypothetical protein SGPRY_006619 [Prymnesium sp.]